MKRVFTVLVFLLFVLNSFAQKIYFTDTSNKWQITSRYTSYPQYTDYYNYMYVYKGDTIVNGTLYKKLKNFLIREDTLAKKVFIKPPQGFGYANTVDTNEQVLYNYNLRLGDTARYSYNIDTQLFKITAFDSMLINGVWHKTWKYRTINTVLPVSDERTVIEGIGSVGGFWWPLQYWVFEGYDMLTCFYTQSGQPHISPKLDNYFDNQSSCTLSVNEASTTGQQKIYIIPNPANTQASIVSAQAVSNGYVVVYNALGMAVYSKKIAGEKSIPLGIHISVPGQYFYRVTDLDKTEVYAGKFIFE